MGARKFVLPRDPPPRAVQDPARRHLASRALAPGGGLPGGARRRAGADRARGADRALMPAFLYSRPCSHPRSSSATATCSPATASPSRSRWARAARRSIHARRLGAELGLDNLYLKFEGTNPTGSFKDRGMVLAVNRAVASGRAGGRVRVDRQHRAPRRRPTPPRPACPATSILPAGKVARGKLAQALAAGARLIDGRRQLRRGAGRGAPAGRGGRGGGRQLDQPRPARRAADGGVGDRRRARARRRTRSPCRSATPATSPPTGAASRLRRRAVHGRRELPRMLGFQADGAAPIVRGEPVEVAGDGGHRDPHRQPGLLAAARSPPGTSPAA